ncbi:MAG: hypothetical protein ACRENK_13835 [Gemmatimonadaceae bacterium]
MTRRIDKRYGRPTSSSSAGSSLRRGKSDYERRTGDQLVELTFVLAPVPIPDDVACMS